MISNHDTSFIVNTNDEDLTPIRISLPDPPPLHLIDGYGLPNDEQYFRRKKTPQSLIELERKIYKEFQDVSSSHNNRINGYTITRKFWNYIYDNIDDYEEELKFINNFWWYSIYGYWFFNDGQPVYITGRYFHFLHTWFMPDVKEGDSYPEYRHDRDRPLYLFKEYIRETDETFALIDKGTGLPIKQNSKYKIKELGGRVFFGISLPKTRRTGATSQGLHDLYYESVFKVRDGNSVIVSMDGDNADAHYKEKLLPMWRGMPLWMKPIWAGGSTPSKLQFSLPNGIYGDYSIDSTITPTLSAKVIKNDGRKIHSGLYDEEGKSQVDIHERWRVNRLAMSTAHGNNIIGFCTHPSTVEDITEFGKQYKELCNDSNFYERTANGQTVSGLSVIFFPAHVGMEGFIDRFGKAVIDTPTELQIRLRPDAIFAKIKMGALQEIMDVRNNLLRRAKTNPSAMNTYRSEVRKNPIRYAECWIGESGMTGMPIEDIDKRLSELERNRLDGNAKAERGFFVDRGGKVEFVPNEDGHWTVSKRLPLHETCLSTSKLIYDTYRKINVRHKAPQGGYEFIIGVDPYTQLKHAETKRYSRNDSLSNGGIAVFMRLSEMDKTRTPEEITSGRFVATLNMRFMNTDDFSNEVLKAAMYYNAMVYPERNKNVIEPYFMEKECGGYLLYDLDKYGKFVQDAGFYTSNNIKQDIFDEHMAHLSFRCSAEEHEDYLLECKEIKNIDQMTKYDLFTAAGAALLGDKVMRKHEANRWLSSNKKSKTLTYLELNSVL